MQRHPNIDLLMYLCSCAQWLSLHLPLCTVFFKDSACFGFVIQGYTWSDQSQHPLHSKPLDEYDQLFADYKNM